MRRGVWAVEEGVWGVLDKNIGRVRGFCSVQSRSERATCRGGALGGVDDVSAKCAGVTDSGSDGGVRRTERGVFDRACSKIEIWMLMQEKYRTNSQMQIANSSWEIEACGVVLSIMLAACPGRSSW